MKVSLGYLIEQERVVDNVESFGNIQSHRNRSTRRLLLTKTASDPIGDGKEGRDGGAIAGADSSALRLFVVGRIQPLAGQRRQNFFPNQINDNL